MKSFLELSILVDKTVSESTGEVMKIAEPVVTVEAGSVGTEPNIENVKVERPKGVVEAFVFENADFSLSPKKEAERMFVLASETGLHTNVRSLETTFYRLRKKMQTTEAVQKQKVGKVIDKAVPRGRKKKEESTVIIAKYLESTRSFLQDSEIAAVAITELIERVQMMELDRASLLKEIGDLKKENTKLRSGLKKKLAEFFKNI